MNDWQLLQDWSHRRSESAFAVLVERHWGFVHASARRQLQDNPGLAGDVTQAVFSLLAQKAGSFRQDIILESWLFRSTRFMASRVIREEQRRKRREFESACMNTRDMEPGSSGLEEARAWVERHLDDAIASLPTVERDAVILRFLQKKPLREVGAVMGLSEEAARKRVSRAIEKLRSLLVRRGAMISVSALSALLVDSQAESVPDNVVSEVANTATGTVSTTAPVVASLVAGGLRDWFWTEMRRFLPGTIAAAAMLFLGSLWMMVEPWRESVSTLTATQDASTSGIPTGRSGFDASGSVVVTSNNSGHVLSILTLDKETGQPVAGARVRYAYTGLDGNIDALTDTNGLVDISIPKEVPERLHVWLSAAGYVPVMLMWQGYEFVGRNISHTCRLDKGRMLVGEVRDEEGRPVTGARVEMRGFGLDLVKRENIGFTRDLTAVYSDATGRFQSDQRPSRIQDWGYRISVVHPQFVRASLDINSLEQFATNQQVTLKRGTMLSGRVVDESGFPVPDAKVWENHNTIDSHWETRTGANGDFEIGPFVPGSIPIAVEADGYETLEQVVTNATAQARVTLQMQHKGDTGGANSSFVSGKRVRIFGTVTDSATGEMVSRFRVLREEPRGTARELVGDGSSGQFDWTITIYSTDQFSLIVEADGYIPSESDLRKVDEQELAFEFRLKKGNWISGRVVRPDGRPAAGAEIGLSGDGFGPHFLPPDRFITFGHPINQTVADSQGLFSLAPMLNTRDVRFVHETGCAVMPADSVTNVLVRLQVWGAIEGTLLIGGQPAPHRTVNLGFNSFDPDAPRIVFDFKEKTDSQGRFRFNRVPPGTHMLQRLINHHEGTEGPIGIGHPQLVEVRPGETTQVVFGAITGRTVIGQLKQEGMALEVDWKQTLPSLQEQRPDYLKPTRPAERFKSVVQTMESVQMREYFRQVNRWHNSMRRYFAEVQPDGRIWIDNVPPGRYTLIVQRSLDGRVSPFKMDVIVPEPTDTNSSEPVDLGVVSVGAK